MSHPLLVLGAAIGLLGLALSYKEEKANEEKSRKPRKPKKRKKALTEKSAENKTVLNVDSVPTVSDPGEVSSKPPLDEIPLIDATGEQAETDPGDDPGAEKTD